MLFSSPDHKFAFNFTLPYRVLILARGLRDFAGDIAEQLTDGNDTGDIVNSCV